MKTDSKIRTWMATVIVHLLVIAAFVLTAPLATLAAPGGGGGGGGEEETAGNNLSFPAATFTSAVLASWNPPASGELGVHYSFGCDQGEMSGQWSYPNTSCVDDLMNPTVYYTAEECSDDILPSPCQGLPVSRIYWQKVDANNWSADQDIIAPDAGLVDYLNWGDALEAVSWKDTSVIRVETQPYSSRLAGFDPRVTTCEAAALAAGEGFDPAVDCKVGFQMWHVSGQGQTEQWGVRAEEAVSYNYDSPFQIINTGTAQLNLAKMTKGAALCPSPGGGGEGEVALQVVNAAPGTFAWDAASHVWTGTDGTGTPYTWQDSPYNVELSVSGKYVYGYNWRMRDVTLPQGWDKAGWWRLTFYTTDDAVRFDDAMAPTGAPPDVPAQLRELPRTEFITALSTEAPPAESDALYTPVIDAGNNLTYLDVCITGSGVIPTCTDSDGDGFAVEGGDCGAVDCNDSDPAISPGAVEHCTDGLDNNCNGLTDKEDPAAIGCPQNQFGIFRGGSWYFDANGDGDWDAEADKVCPSFGLSSDIPVSADMNGDGFCEIGVFRNGVWFFDMNGNNAWEADIDKVFLFGMTGDVPVAGDWNGDGTCEIGVIRDGTWILDQNGNGQWEADSDKVFLFGMTGDVPVTGDWNGDGTTEVGVFRNGTWVLDADGSQGWTPEGDTVATFGMAGDKPVVRDWNGDGTCDIGIFRNGLWAVDADGSGGWTPGSDGVYVFGMEGDRPLCGRWH